jgi:hypothetical protein
VEATASSAKGAGGLLMRELGLEKGKERKQDFSFFDLRTFER